MCNDQAEAAAKYGEELRTEAQQASSFIYHLKRFNNWVKATVRESALVRIGCLSRNLILLPREVTSLKSYAYDVEPCFL